MEEQESSSSPRETASALSAAALRELQQKAQSALSASRQHTARLEADISRRLDEIASALSEQTAAENEDTSEAEQLRAEIATHKVQLQKSQQAWLEKQAALVEERDGLLQQAEEISARHSVSQDDWRKQLVNFEARLGDQQNSWNEQRMEWAVARAALEHERDELQQKFELALEDVQRLRERTAEMEHDLARRPEVNQADSAELVALRAERDALASRVEELEQQPKSQIDPDAEQQVADLQRRFELAVEDVRELKTKNARLESQLAAAASRPSGVKDPGAMDWESQKRRLLATLEEHTEDENDAALKKERATIAATIEMTDAVVAEKDRRIADLLVELETKRYSPAEDEEVRSRKIDDLIDADTVIAEHRQRAQQLEQEMDKTLRAAELELSVERAKMARQKNELEELRSTLEAQRQLFAANGVTPTPGAPKRRWLSKLGIDGKE